MGLTISTPIFLYKKSIYHLGADPPQGMVWQLPHQIIIHFLIGIYTYYSLEIYDKYYVVQSYRTYLACLVVSTSYYIHSSLFVT